MKIRIHKQILSGQPCVPGRRIPTFILAGRFIAGDSISFIAKDYSISRQAVTLAIRYELAKAKKAKQADDMVQIDTY